MRELTSEDIRKNNVDNVKEFYVLKYLKNNLNITEFKLYLVGNNNIKVVDKNNDVLYFCYDESKKEVVYDEELIKQNKDYELSMWLNVYPTWLVWEL